MKIYKRKFSIISVVTLALLLMFNTSCNNWIDIEPENDLIQQEFWKTKDDLMAVVAATYDATRDISIAGFVLGEIRADLVTLPSGDNGLFAIAGNKIKTTTWGTQWGDFYRTINLANTVMHYAPIVQGSDKTVTDELLNQINSEMIFIRSLAHYYIARIWKDAPLVLNATISDTVDFYLPKSTEAQILNRLVSDLEYASSIATTNDVENGRVNKYAILSLLADIKLWQEDYDGCLEICNQIINSNRFSLESNATWFNLYYPGMSPNESIFEIQFEDNLQSQESPFSAPYIDWNIGNYLINLARYGYDNTDIRILNNKGPAWKYIGLDETGRNSARRKSGNYSANFIFYRYAEILMMKAECLAEQGDFAGANDLISQISERAGVIHNDALTIKSFRTALLAERAREFGAEGKRWFELLRFAKRNHFENQQLIIDVLLSKAEDAQDLAIMKSNVLDTMSYYLPIHEDEIRLNRNLVQNPFYDR